MFHYHFVFVNEEPMTRRGENVLQEATQTDCLLAPNLFNLIKQCHVLKDRILSSYYYMCS